jgi:hypothetical protein
MRYCEDLVHESYQIKGSLGYLREHVLQYPWNSIDQATAKIQRYSTLMAQRYAEMGRKTSFPGLVFSPAAMFLKVYFIQQGFRDGRHGFVLAVLYAYYSFLKYAKLWELQKGTAK